ncbi:MAG: hypothetical protein ABEJ67_05000 [Halanaeroarchaeum sp.]
MFLWTPEHGFGFHEIGEVVNEERSARAVSFDPETLQVRTHAVTDYIENPRQRIYEVTLSSGRQVRVTADHNLFTLDSNGEVSRVASENAEGTYVMVPDSLPGPRGAEREIDLVSLLDGRSDVVVYAADGVGTVDWSGVNASTRQHYEGRGSAPLDRVRTATVPDSSDVAIKQGSDRLPRSLPVTPAFGWVLGFYIAAGSARRQQLVFTNSDDGYLERVADYFRQFDARTSSQRDPEGASQLTVRSALWSAVVQSLAGAGETKTIPDRAWNWEDDVLESLLAGLMDGDGQRGEGRETLYTANEDLADRAMYLGTRLGRLTRTDGRRRRLPSGTETEEWSVDVYRDGYEVGQYVPTVGTLLRELRAAAGMTTREAADAIGRSSETSISNLENHECDAIDRDSLRELRDAYASAGVGTQRLDAILEGGVRFERVTSVEETDRVEVTYDLEVRPDGRPIENFLGGRGGVFLSNTAGFIDPGYRGKITLELSNLGTAPVALSPDMRISQLVFTELKTPARTPYGSERGSKYQDQSGPQASKIQEDEEFHRS